MTAATKTRNNESTPAYRRTIDELKLGGLPTEKILQKINQCKNKHIEKKKRYENQRLQNDIRLKSYGDYVIQLEQVGQKIIKNRQMKTAKQSSILKK